MTVGRVRIFCIFLFSLQKEVASVFDTMTCTNQQISTPSLEIAPTRTIYLNVKTAFKANRSIYGLKIYVDNNPPTVNRTYWRYLLDTGSASNIAFSTLQIPLNNDDLRLYPTLVSVPVMVGGLVFVYNIPNVTNLNLTTRIIADIYLGKIRFWNDNKITSINPNIDLPNKTITFVTNQGDYTSDTYVFTSALSSISDEWKYGSVVDYWPDLANFTFNTVLLGMPSMLRSKRYSIGYMSWSNAIVFAGDLPKAKIVNDMGTVNEINDNSIKQAVEVVENYQLPGAVPNPLDIYNGYPFIYFHYVVLNQTTSPNVTCCSMQETVGLIEFLLDVLPSGDTVNYSLYGYMPVHPNMARNSKLILSTITCDGRFMETEYKKTITLFIQFSYQWQLAVAIGTSLLALLVLMLFAFVFYHKRVKFANETFWLISPDELDLSVSSTINKSSIGSSATIGSQRRNSSETALCSRKALVNSGKFATTVWFWKKNETLIFAKEIKLNAVSKWRRKTKLQMTIFTKQFCHPNLCPVLGVSIVNLTSFIISQYCSKGTLNYVLSTSRYQLSTDIKTSLAREVLLGLIYLHRKNIVHGSLSSLTCYVDIKWNVKLSDWATYAIAVSEDQQTFETPALTGIEDDETLIKLLYIDPEAVALKKLTMAADIYSYGMLLLQIFTRRIPYFEQVELGSTSYPDIIQLKFDLREVLPSVNATEVPTEIENLIVSSIRTTETRPDIQTIAERLNNTSSKARNGLVDTMLEVLEEYVENLEETVVERTAELSQMTERIRNLLNELLPPQIAEKFINQQAVEPEFYQCVTIFFSDVVGFTSISAKSTPYQVMNFLNELWKLFDSTMINFDVYKVDTIGDAYMIVSGLPIRNGIDHCKHIADLALVLNEKAKTFTVPHMPNEKVNIRIGINSGSVTAGIIGYKMPQYCVFGDTVNTASRMESTSLPGNIQVSEFTTNLIVTYFPDYHLEYRGETQVKGKGTMKTYWLLGRNVTA